MAELRDAGCMAFSQADAPITDNQVLLHALEYAATFGFCVWLRPQDRPSRAAALRTTARSRRGWACPAIPVCAETVALSTILILARETGARIHLCRLSSADGLEMVRAAKAKGAAVTCDVSVNHVHLSEMDIGYFDANCNLVPPLRSLRDRDALRARPRRWHASTPSAPTTRRWTTMPSSCRSPRPSRARPGWNCCCR